ncbi:MAG TPA: hydantoinase B/oxoprolinase family protein, partial [Anaerolineae bacterium]
AYGQAYGQVSDLPRPTFLVASRAHHADVGGMSPGSMPLSTEIYQEGLIIRRSRSSRRGRRIRPCST